MHVALSFIIIMVGILIPVNNFIDTSIDQLQFLTNFWEAHEILFSGTFLSAGRGW